MTATSALDGVRVLDLASVGPGARASRILADYGADVVKVGAVPRAGAVQIIPPYYAYSGNRGMRRALFDLKSDEGRAAFLTLADDADVIIESFRPGVVDKLGVGYAAVSERNGGIVYCSTSGFGQTGPRSTWAGHDENYLATSGVLDSTGRRADGRPALPGAAVGGGPVISPARVRRSTGADWWRSASSAGSTDSLSGAPVRRLASVARRASSLMNAAANPSVPSMVAARTSGVSVSPT